MAKDLTTSLGTSPSCPLPNVIHSRKYLDFGMGFYLTSLEKQARDYGQRFIRRGEPAIMNVFEFAEECQGIVR